MSQAELKPLNIKPSQAMSHQIYKLISSQRANIKPISSQVQTFLSHCIYLGDSRLRQVAKKRAAAILDFFGDVTLAGYKDSLGLIKFLMMFEHLFIKNYLLF